MEYVFKDVRVFVPTDPAQSVQLICTADNIGKKRRELERANVQSDANLAQLLLQNSRNQPWAFLGRGFHSEMKTHAVDGRISRLFEQLPRLLGIVIVARDISVVGPTLRRKQAVSRPREIAKQIMNDHRTV